MARRRIVALAVVMGLVFLAAALSPGAVQFLRGQPTAKAIAKPPTATPAESLKVMKDFKAELLYSVPKETQGSWVNMCVDPKGRLIVSDQYGPLYRITPPIQSGVAKPGPQGAGLGGAAGIRVEK